MCKVQIYKSPYNPFKNFSVEGPTFPVPLDSPTGFRMRSALASWNLRSAALVRVPKNVVSCPGEPGPVLEMTNPLLFKMTWSCLTSRPLSPYSMVLVPKGCEKKAVGEVAGVFGVLVVLGVLAIGMLIPYCLAICLARLRLPMDMRLETCEEADPLELPTTVATVGQAVVVNV